MSGTLEPTKKKKREKTVSIIFLKQKKNNYSKFRIFVAKLTATLKNILDIKFWNLRFQNQE
jgi:hypothetical protein